VGGVLLSSNSEKRYVISFWVGKKKKKEKKDQTFGPFVSNEIFQLSGHDQETQLENIGGVVIPMTSMSNFFFSLNKKKFKNKKMLWA
jgi:hypothetical protein